MKSRIIFIYGLALATSLTLFVIYTICGPLAFAQVLCGAGLALLVVLA